MKQLCVIAALLVLSLLSSSSSLAAAAKKKAKPPAAPSVAVAALDGIASAVDKSAVELELRALLPAAGYTVQKKDKTDSTLATVKKLGLACDSGDVDCLIRVGALSGVNVVIKGLLSTDDTDTFALDLVAVDVNALRERSRVRVLVPRTGAGRKAALESAVTGVLRPEAWRGLLRVDVGQRGASIVVDGVPRGFSPLSAPIELTPGPHALFVVLEGFRSHKESVVVVYEDEVGVDVTLVPGVSEDAPQFTTAPKVVDVAPSATPARRHPLRVVVYDVEATGVPPRVAQVMGTLLVAELRKREGVSVLDSGELRALVGDGASTAGDVRGCSVDQCFAEVAEALGADGVVVAQLTQLEGQVLFGLRRIDQQKQEVTGSFLERVPVDDTAALLPLVGKSIEATFGDVAVRAGQTVGVDARATRIMNPPPLPPILSGSLYVGTAAAGVVTLVATGVGVFSYVGYNAVLDDAARSATTAAPDENKTLRDHEQRFGVAQVVGLAGIGATVVLGAAAVLTGMSTDWENDGAVVAPDTGRAP